jgi:LPS sulfotransferase NodH
MNPTGDVSQATAGLIRDPIVILAAPRSGSSLLFGLLSSHPKLWSLYRESNELLEGPFDPLTSGRSSNALAERDLDRDSRDWLLRAFFARAGNLEVIPPFRRLPLEGRGRRRVSITIAKLSAPFKRPPIRLVEKSPKNSLRVPFMRALFPDARFLHLTRDPRSNIASLVRAWQTPDRYKTYPLPPGYRIEGYDGTSWSFMLQPGWLELNGRTLAEVCADQWRACNEASLRDLAEIEGARTLRLRYEDLISDPIASLRLIASWADLEARPFDRFARGLPALQSATPPDERKWLALRDEVERVLPLVRDARGKLGYD